MWADSFKARTGWRPVIFVVTMLLASCLCIVLLAIVASHAPVSFETAELESDRLVEGASSSSEEVETVSLAELTEFDDGSSGCCSVAMGIAMSGDDGTLTTADCSTPATIQPISDASPVTILRVQADGSGNQELDEYIEFRNDSGQPLQLQGWRLIDAADHRFNFPNFLMEVGQTCRVYTNEYHHEWCGFNYASEQGIWGDSGECATIYDETGAEVTRSCN